jgi:L-iditol 2-dehydrogenase
MATMKALVKDRSRVALRDVPVPDLRNADDVLVRVVTAGVCRTDLYVAQGRIPVSEPRILGHEFSAVVEASGPAVPNLRRGERVAVVPLIPCRICANCTGGDAINCLRRTMLGVERDGAFAEFVIIPARCIYPLPGGLSFLAGAYAEPVAAALAVLNAGIRPEQTGLVLGHNRFATLVQRLLETHGFGQVTLHDPAGGAAQLPADHFDFVIETAVSTETLQEIMRVARPRGTVVLKSRLPGLVGLDLTAAIAKELTLRAVQYGPFSRAIALLAEGRLDLDGLLGPAYPLDDYEQVFAQAAHSEACKLFFRVADRHVWDR